VQYQSTTEGSTVEKSAETQTSIRLASHLVRAPNSRSGGYEFASPMRRELGALTKSEVRLSTGPIYTNTSKNRIQETIYFIGLICRLAPGFNYRGARVVCCGRILALRYPGSG
jgi:hypothetical protein